MSMNKEQFFYAWQIKQSEYKTENYINFFVVEREACKKFHL